MDARAGNRCYQRSKLDLLDVIPSAQRGSFRRKCGENAEKMESEKFFLDDMQIRCKKLKADWTPFNGQRPPLNRNVVRFVLTVIF
jgi:hypothetical protein